MSRLLPILFNGEMVRAILDGRKTVTRRVIKPQPTEHLTCGNNWKQLLVAAAAPYQPGDILYVRETWSPVFVRPRRYLYKVGCKEAENLPVKWHPSIHMPKEAARIWLKVKDVRVERLQEITEEQAKAEGANWKNGKNVGWEEKMSRTAVERFSEIWDSTIKESDLKLYGWDANPWVWVIEFERCDKPENI